MGWGRNHNVNCPGCGMNYDDLLTGLTFGEVRRMIIAIQFDNKTQKTKYGRRNGTLGYWHELKMMHWDQHVGECTDAQGRKAGDVAGEDQEARTA